MDNIFKKLYSNNYIDKKGFQGTRVDRTRDGVIVGFASHKDGALHGACMSRSKFRDRPLEYIGYWKHDGEIGFWICDQSFI